MRHLRSLCVGEYVFHLIMATLQQGHTRGLRKALSPDSQAGHGCRVVAPNHDDSHVCKHRFLLEGQASAWVLRSAGVCKIAFVHVHVCMCVRKFASVRVHVRRCVCVCVQGWPVGLVAAAPAFKGSHWSHACPPAHAERKEKSSIEV